MRITFIQIVSFTSLCCAGCSVRQDEGRVEDQHSQSVNIAAVQQMKLSTPVMVQGTMVEKCPVAGCWFMLHNQTGTIKVDLKATKQNVVNVPLNTEVTVRGKVAQNGSQKMIQAVSATF